MRIEVYTYYCLFRKKKKRAHGRTCKTHKGIELLKHLNRNWALEAFKLIQTRKAIQSPKLTAVLLDTFEVLSKFCDFWHLGCKGTWGTWIHSYLELLISWNHYIANTQRKYLIAKLSRFPRIIFITFQVFLTYTFLWLDRGFYVHDNGIFFIPFP